MKNTPSPASLPPLAEILAGVVPFALDLRVPFRGLTRREGLLIKGPSGWGEFAPFDDYDDVRASRWLAAAIEAAWGTWPDARRERVEVNAIIPAVDSMQAGALAREAIWDAGCRTLKVKVGGALADDEARVVAIRDALDSAGIDSRIRLDANAAWSVDQAIASLRRLASYGIDYVEQPCAGLDDVARVRSEVDIAVAVDEGIRIAEDPENVRLVGIADYAICKPMPLGGVAATLRVSEMVGVPVVVSGSLDTAVGLGTCLAAAAALEVEPAACGLGTGMLFAADVIDPPLRPVDGHLRVERIAPSLDALVAAGEFVSDERALWWRRRLASAYAVVDSDSGAIEDAASIVEG